MRRMLLPNGSWKGASIPARLPGGYLPATVDYRTVTPLAAVRPPQCRFGRTARHLRRWATPDDIADVIVFLASAASRFVTGETISVDGGMARTLDLYGGGGLKGPSMPSPDRWPSSSGCLGARRFGLSSWRVLTVGT